MNVRLPLWLLALAGAVSVAPTTAGERRSGYVAEPDSVYRATPLRVRTRAFLPPAVDLSERMPIPGNQGSMGSCTAWAVAYAARSYYAIGQQNIDHLDQQSALSPAYVYNRVSQGNCMHATSIHEILTLMRDEGVVPLSQFPYDANECSRQPTPAQLQAATAYRVNAWQRLDPGDLDAIKGQLAQGHPVIIPLNLPASFDHLSGAATYNDRPDRQFFHTMVAVGYDDQRQAFRFMNSWDTDWGDNGFVWIAYDAYKTMQMDRAYVIDLPPPARKMAIAPAPAPAQAQAPQNNLPPLFASSLKNVAPAPSPVAPGPQKTPANTLFKSTCGGSEAWPLCEIRINFREALHNRQMLDGQLQGASAAPTFLAGDALRIVLTTPAYPAYIYISYLQASGEVVHLHWPGTGSQRPLPPNTRLVFGNGQPAGASFRIGPPFGDEAVVVVASASPLFFGQMPAMRDDRDYLSEFRRAFAIRPADQHGSRRLEALVLPLRTAAH